MAVGCCIFCYERLRRLETTTAGRANRSGITAANEAEPVCGVRGSFELPEPPFDAAGLA